MNSESRFEGILHRSRSVCARPLPFFKGIPVAAPVEFSELEAMNIASDKETQRPLLNGVKVKGRYNE